MRKPELRFLAALLCLAVFSWGFFPAGKGWQQGVKTIGIRVRLPEPPEMTVRHEKRKGGALLGKKEEAREKDENMQARLLIAMKDFSLSKQIFDEFKMAFDRHTDWKTVPEGEFSQTPPDVIFDVKVTDYELVKRLGKKNDASVVFGWMVEARRAGQEKPLWRVSKRKKSSSRNLKKWMFDKADMVKGEVRAHILFSVQDLMNSASIPRRRVRGE